MKLKEFWSVAVEILFIWYSANAFGSKILTTGFKERFTIQKSE